MPAYYIFQWKHSDQYGMIYRTAGGIFLSGRVKAGKREKRGSRTIKVFLVEDEPIIRKGIRDNIDWAANGFQFVGEGGDGEYAYPLILETDPDILVMDVKMSFMDGLELSRLVKKALPDIKIVILSGYNEFDYAKEAIKMGISDYILKPVTSAALVEALRRVADTIREERGKSCWGGILPAIKSIRNFSIRRTTGEWIGD